MEPTPSTPETETLAMPRIVRTPGVCGGKPRIDGHRITVEHIAVWHEKMGMMPAEIVATHPTIALAQVHAALAYYWSHQDEIQEDIRNEEKLVAELKAKTEPSRIQERLAELHGTDDSLPSG